MTNNSYRLFLKSMDAIQKINQTPYLSSSSSIEEQAVQIVNYYNIHHSEMSNWRRADILLDNVKNPNNPDLYYESVILKNNINNKNNTKNNNIRKEKVEISVEVNSIKDLIDVINTYPLDSNKEYNIDLATLHKIKDPLNKLNEMIGMKSLKENIIYQILFYIQELHTSNTDFLHTVIYGSPGTGKTEVAKILGDIFCKLNILKKGKFKKVTRSDLIAGYLGQTALKTADVIKECIGGVLFIDEAYALGSSDKKDSFSKECIDTLCEALSDHKEDLMVIISGYERELNECFFQYNQGLNSRFIWRFKTDDYSAEDLYNIFLKKVQDMKWKLTTECNKIWFEKRKEYFKFYGRDMETLFTKTKMTHSRRIFGKIDAEKKNISMDDLDKGFELFIQNEEVKNRKEGENMKKMISSMYV
jgi:Holliday junction resolvasome RuvABC ATP-dependent DNA helicase subunit